MLYLVKLENLMCNFCSFYRFFKFPVSFQPIWMKIISKFRVKSGLQYYQFRPVLTGLLQSFAVFCSCGLFWSTYFSVFSSPGLVQLWSFQSLADMFSTCLGMDTMISTYIFLNLIIKNQCLQVQSGLVFLPFFERPMISPVLEISRIQKTKTRTAKTSFFQFNRLQLISFIN